MTFKYWLDSKRKEWGAAEAFCREMEDNHIQWPSEINGKADVANMITQSGAEEPAQKSLLKNIEPLWSAYEKWEAKPRENEQALNGCMEKLIGALVDNPIATVIAGISIFLIVIIFFALSGKTEFLQNLSNVEFARGLITFLFALGTIGIALIITFSVFASERPLAESKERFYRGKEILTIFIGILGTIVGFYFGSPTDTEKSISPVELSEIHVSELEPVMEKPLSLCVLASGGIPPYTYTLTFMEGKNKFLEFKEQPSEKGLIFLSFLPQQKDRAYRIKPILAVADARGQSNKIMGEDIEIKKAQGN